MEIVITGQIVCSLSLSQSVNFVPVQYVKQISAIVEWALSKRSGCVQRYSWRVK